MITLGYKILFTINVLHDYYGDHLSRETVLVPTVETQQTLKNYQLIFKPTLNGGLILAQVKDSDGTLQIPVSNTQNFKLRFYLNATTAYFYNRTNLAITPVPVTNLIPNRRGFYLSNAESDDGNIFDVTGFQKPGRITELKHLTKTAGSQVSNEDELIFLPAIFRVTFDIATFSFSINIKDRNDVDVIPTTVITQTEKFTEYEIKLTENLPAGFYKISLDGAAAQNVFLSTQAFHDNPFAVIDIVHPPKTDKFDFLQKIVNGTDEKNQVKEKADYFIWFKTREIAWKYVFPKGIPAGVDINFSGGTAQVDNSLISYDKLEIKENYSKVKLVIAGEEKDTIPNPTGKIIKQILVPKKNDNTVEILTDVAEVFL